MTEWELLKASDLIKNVPETFHSWREGTVIRSWLLDLLDRALQADPELNNLKGYARTRARAGGRCRRRSTSRCRCR
jgi:6-phosphogluconate dehydrogenase (decarboxylating)